MITCPTEYTALAVHCTLCSEVLCPSGSIPWQCFVLAALVAQAGKRLPAVQETWVQSLGREDPLEKETATTPVLVPGKSHGRRSLAGYSPWGRKEWDTTEQLHSLTLATSWGLIPCECLPFL